MTNSRHLNVYYLDDEELLLDAFAERFSTSQIKIVTFLKPNELITKVSSNAPDVVVIDYLMPGMKGDEVARRLPNSISRIMVTGNIDKQDDQLFERVFEKPFPEEDIERYFLMKLNQKYSK